MPHPEYKPELDPGTRLGRAESLLGPFHCFFTKDESGRPVGRPEREKLFFWTASHKSIQESDMLRVLQGLANVRCSKTWTSSGSPRRVWIRQDALL